MKGTLCTAFLLLLAIVAQATHNRAGEITYRHLGGLTYEVTVTTCTKTSSPADRDWLELDWGDNTPLDSIERTGIQFLPINAQINTYVETHTYVGPGSFLIRMEDPNRNSDIENIPLSVNQSFCISSLLIISPFGGLNGAPAYNNSVQLLNPAKDDACINKPWIHNAGAVDIDGDSLSYSLVDCSGENCGPILGYTLPDFNGGGVFAINSTTGDVTWNVPGLIGEFNIAIKISEFRNGILVGYVIRDMQITVINCSNNPPSLQDLPDTCVKAGTTISFPVIVTDPDPGQTVDIDAFGSPFQQVNSPASISSTSNQGGGTFTANFNWNTNCDHVALAPHVTYFKAEDDGGDVDLSDIISMNITVIAPPVTNVSATPFGNAVNLTWDPSICGNASGYKIYRREGLSGYVPSHCETGVPSTIGYIQVGSTSGINSTAFTDNASLTVGQEYCYIIIACFPDGAESCLSAEVCASLSIDLPVITNVDVDVTNTTAGADSVKWINPTELDTLQFTGPYSYHVFRADNYGEPIDFLGVTPPSTQLYLTQDFFYDTGINTQDQPYSYRVLLFSGTDTVGYSLRASSIYLTITPNDNVLYLDWTEIVPWSNDSFYVYRENPTGSGNFTFIGSTTEHTYADTGLINGANYCYYVEGYGSYAHPSIPAPFTNRSQITCAEPVDLTPPCPPSLTVDFDCSFEFNTLSWNNPNNSCADDVTSYNIYYSATDTGTMELIATIDSATDTIFTHNNNGSLAGCYSVTASDTFNIDLGRANESDSSNRVCIDNCPVYVLPNVFSPNSDEVNDFFVPFPYRFVEDIKIEIFNRWGQVVFTSTDPDINWDGTNQETGQPLTDGVYYYLCTVNTIRLSGIEPIQLNGYVRLFNEQKPSFK